MNRPLARAERGPLAWLVELLAVLAATAAAYELVVAFPLSGSETTGEIFWCGDAGDYDGLAEWAGPQIDEVAPASMAAAVLPLGSESLPMQLVGLGCALLGVASSLYGRIRSDACADVGARRAMPG
jgi:hypothetical protein